jgi:AraC-like DNA-binding protein
MSNPDLLLSQSIVRRGHADLELHQHAAVAIGLLADVPERQVLSIRTDVLPSFTTTRLGRTTISSLEIGAFQAVLPDTSSSNGHDWLNVLVQDKGLTRFENKDHAGNSTPGQIVIFDGYAETAIQSDGRSTRIVVSIPKSALPAPILKRIDHIVHIVEPTPGLPRIFTEFMRATCRDAGALGEADRNRLDRALLHSVGDLIETFGDPLRAKGPKSLARIRNAALHMIETDINGFVSTADIAERLECSERYLFLAFQDAGMSPGRYIQTVRLERARIAIEASLDTSITEIAYASGFQSYSHFSRLFKKTYGITAKSLRSEK